MRVIPVIDLKQGLVVRGVAGRRHEYRPITSVLAADPRPETVGRAFAQLGFRQVYVADLDAIAGAPPAREIYQQLVDCGLELLIDAGVATAETAASLGHGLSTDRSAIGVVAALETLPDASALADMLAAVGQAQLVFSLDLKQGQPLAASHALAELRPLQIATIAARLGVCRMIVLDLAAVGMDGGVPTTPLCRALRCRFPHLEIVAGGGVRHARDLSILAAAGCDGALVASALHDGRLLPPLTTTSARAFP